MVLFINTYQSTGNRLLNGRLISWLPRTQKTQPLLRLISLRLKLPVIFWNPMTMMKHQISSRL
jgi:hypothetical protein